MDTLFIIDSDHPLDKVRADLEAACARHKFGVIAVHDLAAKMREKGVVFERDCLVFEVCNPHQARKVLEEDMAISTALPCRISLYREEGRMRLATIQPEVMLTMFGAESAAAVASEVGASLRAIMEEAAGV